MRQEYGLVIAGDDGSLEEKQLYDTRKPKLTLDPKPNPPHFDVLQDFSAGTKWTIDNADTAIREEVLFKIKHGLPFTPMFAAFFVATTTPPDYAGRKNLYSLNKALILYNAIGLGDEMIYADADDTYFYIKHSAQRFGYGDPGNYTFFGSDFKYRIRYMIFNRPTFLLPGGIMPQ